MEEKEVTRRTVLAAGGGLAMWAAKAAAYDVVVYGATPGGIGAAVAAARLGRRVALCALEDHIGGIVSKRHALNVAFYRLLPRPL